MYHMDNRRSGLGAWTWHVQRAQRRRPRHPVNPRRSTPVSSRDLARSRTACLMNRQFPENLLFGQATFCMKNLEF